VSHLIAKTASEHHGRSPRWANPIYVLSILPGGGAAPLHGRRPVAHVPCPISESARRSGVETVLRWKVLPPRQDCGPRPEPGSGWIRFQPVSRRVPLPRPGGAKTVPVDSAPTSAGVLRSRSADRLVADRSRLPATRAVVRTGRQRGLAVRAERYGCHTSGHPPRHKKVLEIPGHRTDPEEQVLRGRESARVRWRCGRKMPKAPNTVGSVPL
jgi:hypothetical protein